jgi:hypothetical protein
MENTSETKTAKTPKVTFGQCNVKPLATSKAGATRCPRMVMTQNEYGLCGGHLNFLIRGAQIELIDGRILNRKPAAEPKAPQAEPEKVAGLNVPEGMTVVEVNPIIPENVDKAVKTVGKKLSKKAQAAEALRILREKRQDAIVPVNREANLAAGMAARTLPKAQ